MRNKNAVEKHAKDESKLKCYFIKGKTCSKIYLLI